MEKLWYASFGRDREKGVRVQIRIIFTVIAALWMGIVSVSARVENDLGPVAALPLPQFETERVMGAQVETQVPKVGDQILFQVKGAHSPELHAVADGKETIEDQGWAIIEAKPLGNSTDLSLTVIPLKAGQMVFPSLALQDPLGKVVGRTTPVPIEISSSISSSDPKPDQPEDVQPPAGLQFPFWIVILAGILGAILVILLGYSLYRGIKEYAKRRKKPERILSEDEIALSELFKLNELGFLEKGEFKRHYFKISEILKNYVGDRYQFDAPESTTGEMIETLQGRTTAKVMVNEFVVSSLSLLFEKLDRVKFTDHVPDTEESLQILGKAREFIVSTRRTPIILDSSGLNSSGVDNHADK